MEAPAQAGELAFHAWILIGNVLHRVLRGTNPPPIPNRRRLAELDEQLQTVEPTAMLSALGALGESDRRMLLYLCEQELDAAGPQAQDKLGITEADAEPILHYLAITKRAS